MSRLWRVPACIGVMIVVLMTTAAPASAHTVSGQTSTDFQTRITGVAPPLPALKVRVVELGSRIELTWTGPDDLVIDGYQNEPYLRVGPDGVYRNRLSPATYLNVTRTAPPPPPSYASATAAPEWVKIGSGRTVLWHDHRTHWMGGIYPIEVRRSPGTFHTVWSWTIPMTEGGRPAALTGALVWVPGVSAGPWLALIAALIVVGVAAGLGRRWANVLLVFTAAVVVADVIHAVGTGLDFAGSTGHRVLLIVGGSYYSIVAWVLGIVAIRLLARRSLDGLFAAIFTGLVVGIFGGLTDVGSLTRSQIPFDFGIGLARVVVAVSIGASAGLIGGAVLAYRRNRAAPEHEIGPRPAAEAGTAGAGV